ncbi:hypothetical protein HPB52_011384 [Rhipicephalus sanguineus]|uniref:Uncharacterized protein n=1 Tax=Rhipicephalus sanguineus TaxID=34632 RepID=A0A9D4SP15_RHISA|nr:hypothetical protein HPB52_011384 [Rhipicephalus sanguineus]
MRPPAKLRMADLESLKISVAEVEEMSRAMAASSASIEEVARTDLLICETGELYTALKAKAWDESADDRVKSTSIDGSKNKAVARSENNFEVRCRQPR